MRYYILLDNGKRPASVYRMQDAPLLMERWDGKAWVEGWRLAHHLVNGESMLQTVSQRQAEQAIKEMA